jgi:hypothetical protein
MNARALSRIGEPVLIEDAMAYAELQADNKALRTTNATMLLALTQIQDCSPTAVVWDGDIERPWFQVLAERTVQQVEGIE